MSLTFDIIIATFTAPEPIQTDPWSLLLLLPLVAAIAVVYKATKVRTVTAYNFLKETVTLFGSVVVFIAITALVLYVLAWFISV